MFTKKEAKIAFDEFNKTLIPPAGSLAEPQMDGSIKLYLEVDNGDKICIGKQDWGADVERIKQYLHEDVAEFLKNDKDKNDTI